MSEATARFEVPESAAKAERGPVRRAINAGLIGGVVAAYIAATGILERFNTRAMLSSGGEALLTLGLAMLFLATLAAAYVASGRGDRRQAPLLGAISGLASGVVLLAFVFAMKALYDRGLQVSEIFTAVRPLLLDELLLFGRGAAGGALLLTAIPFVLGLLAGSTRMLAPRVRRPLLVALVAFLLMSMIDQLLLPIFLELGLATQWLYAGTGLTVVGALIVTVFAAGLTILLDRRRARAPSKPVPVVAHDDEESARPRDTRETLVLWLGFGSLVYSLALAVLVFAGEELIQTVLLVGFLLGAVAVALGANAARRLSREGRRRPPVTMGLFAGTAGFFVVLPIVSGPFISEVLTSVGLYILLGLGLNIVIGYAGLLDLGYVAFFATGAYTTAILTSRASFLVVETGQGVTNLQYAEQGFTNFWVALPIAVVVSVLIGVLIGAPVLRLRGDYLAIVTLGFGEIIRVLVLSRWLEKWLGGAQGIIQIPEIPPEALELRQPQRIYYLILIFCLLAAFISYRLVSSRVGRAWAAMREDESVAEAMGVSIIKYKLLAFAMGAGIGCLGGTFFAAKIGSVFPGSFELLVSINVLAVIVLGGMGSIPGVIVGSAVLIGLPELLREFAEYRLLFYGAILMAIMIYKPEGLLPNVRRLRELREREEEEEQYEERAGDEGGTGPGLTVGMKDEELGSNLGKEEA
ncbi:MAG TPA: leucine/isoleucine/valine transporter permease subunit [Actinomycetota bacterium]|nr:leucine/isoleucine/valine transporter permease subunit [Actinomycetota bacterium]